MDSVVKKMADMANKTSTGNAGSFAGQLMQVLSESEFQTHVWHLQTTMYSQHMALGGYYDAINGLKDSLIETYQGLHGVRVSGNMDIKIDSTWSESKVMPYFKSLRTKLDGMYTNHYLTPGSLKNIMDEIIALVGKTEYLLTLKH
jgi:hypothetical protein